MRQLCNELRQIGKPCCAGPVPAEPLQSVWDHYRISIHSTHPAATASQRHVPTVRQPTRASPASLRACPAFVGGSRRTTSDEQSRTRVTSILVTRTSRPASSRSDTRVTRSGGIEQAHCRVPILLTASGYFSVVVECCHGNMATLLPRSSHPPGALYHVSWVRLGTMPRRGGIDQSLSK